MSLVGRVCLDAAERPDAYYPPAGDIGTGGREIGFMFGAYKKLRNEYVGVLTGKGKTWGGSFIRPEATGYGVIYFVEHVRRDRSRLLPYVADGALVQMIAKACPEYSLSKPSTLVAISGSGNVAQFTALKVIELGGTVLSLSDSKGSLIATDGGFTKDVIEGVGALKLKGGSLESFASFAPEEKYKYYPGIAAFNSFS